MSCQNLEEGQFVNVLGFTDLRTVEEINRDHTTGLGVHIHKVVTKGPNGDMIYHFDGTPPSARPISDIRPPQS